MSETSRTGLFLLEEVSWGVTPAAALQELRKTSLNFRPIINTVESQEIVSDRQIRDLIKVGEGAEGDFSFEWSYGSYDKPFEGLLCSAFPADIVKTATTISASSVDNSFNDSGNGFVTAGFVSGQIIRSEGFTTPANNGYFTANSVAAGKIIVGGGTLVTEAAGSSRTLRGTPLVNGTTAKSYSMEETFINLAGTTHYIGYTGMRFGGADLNLAPGGIATGSFRMMGKKGVPAAASIGTGGPTAATTSAVMNSVGDVKFLYEGGTAVQLTDIKLNIDNGLRTQEVIGTLGAIGIGYGQFKVTGSISLYLENRTHLDKAINQTLSSLALVVSDSAGATYGNAVAIHLPALKYGQPDKPISGNNGDIFLTLPFTALKHPTLGKTMYMSRFASV